MKTRILFLIFTALSFLHAESTSYTTYVKVTSSLPSYEDVVERTPVQECWNEQVPVTYYQQQYRRPQRQNNTAAAILGGVAGGALGHQIGRGRGKNVATIGGAILGTLAGQNVARQNSYAQETYAQPQTRYESKRHCTTRYKENRVHSFVGYKNVGYYKGKKIVKYSDQRLSKIPVTVTISY